MAARLPGNTTMNSTAQRATVFALLVLLLVSTRLNLPTSVTHFGPVPDAS